MASWRTRRRPGGRATAAIAILGLAVAVLGAVSESAAQGAQVWEFVGFSGSGAVTPLFGPRLATVSADGTFSLLGLPCPQGTSGGTFDVAARMSGTTVAGAVTGACSGQLRAGSLNAAFPNATIASGLVITFGETIVSIAGGIRARAPGPGSADNGAAIALALTNVALLTAAVQNTNIGIRLNALRRGTASSGANFSGLSLTVKGESVPLGSALGMLAGGGASADSGRVGIFANGQGSLGDQDKTVRELGFDFHTAGLTAGVDYRLTDRIILGAAFGYLRTNIGFVDSPSGAAINGYSLSAFGTYFIKDSVYVDGILTYGRNSYDIDRQAVNLLGTSTDRITAGTDGHQLSASASAGYDFTAGGLTFGPTGRVTFIRVHVDGYTERGPAGSSAARIPDQTVESLTTAFGAQAAYAISTRWGVVSPQVKAEWEHEYKGGTRFLTASAVFSPTLPVAAQTNAADRDYVNLGVGVSAVFRHGVSAFVHFEESLGRSHFTNHSFNGGMRFEF